MATTKVSALSALTTTDGNEELLINDGGTSKKVTIDNVLHDSSIRSEHYADGSIDEEHIADDAVTADKLANAINTAIAANTAKTTNATHTGDVTGSGALTIAVDAVDIAMLSATGSAGSSTFLRGDNSWVTPTDTNTVDMGSGFTVSATTDSNATTITQGDDLMIAAGTGITAETTADGTVTITNTVSGGIASLAADTTPQLGGFLDANGNYMQTEKGADIVSASPLVITTVGDYFDVTGTTNFAVMTVAADRQFTLQFDGVLTMTHHATNLDLPSEANITTAAGDVATFQSTGSNTVQCINYSRADGTAIVGGSSFDPDGAVTINDTGADVDFRVESDARTHMLTVDGANNVVGISHGGFMGDLGQGLHIKTTDTGGDAHVSADELVIEHNNNAGITILSANAGVSDGNIFFGDAQDNDIGKIVYNHNDDHMEFFTNTAKQLQLESNGDVSVKTGDIVFTTAGKGICLGVTTNVDANTLADYEEGTWDMEVQGAGGSAGSAAYGGDDSRYTKVGNLVMAWCYRSISATGSWSGILRITGLPFTADGYQTGAISGMSTTNLSQEMHGVATVGGQTYCMVFTGNKMDSVMDYSEFASGAYVVMCFMYQST